jgi:hypothetical protein
VPDSGHNAYLAVHPDGTVDVPANIDVAGVVAAGLDDVLRTADIGTTVMGTAGGAVMEIGDGRAVVTNGVSEVSDVALHHLGSTPRTVVATAIVTVDGRDDYIVDLNTADDTTLTFNVRAGAGEQFPLDDPTEVHFYWIAAG